MRLSVKFQFVEFFDVVAIVRQFVFVRIKRLGRNALPSGRIGRAR